MAFKKAAGSTSTVVKIINTDTLGSREKIKKGKFFFVPLFSVNSDAPGLTLPVVSDGLYPWYKYQFRTKGDDNKPKSNQVRWIDSKLVAGVDDAKVNDPGLTLGLSEKERKNIPGFGVPGLGFPDSKAYQVTVHVPVLWDVQPNSDDDGNIDPNSGEFAMLELNETRFNALVEAMKKAIKPTVMYSANGKDTKYKNVGYGYAYLFDKDTSRGFDTYKIEKTDLTTAEEMWKDNLEKAVSAFDEYKKSAFKYGRFYEHIIEDCANGKVDFEVAQYQVVAEIAKRLLNAWGITYEDTVDGILEAFEESVPTFSLSPGVGISAAIKERTRVNMDELEMEEDEEKYM